MKTPSRSVKKSTGKVSKRSSPSPEMATFGRNQFPRAANDFQEKQTFLKAGGKLKPESESKWNIRFSNF